MIWERFRSHIERFDITTELFKNINRFVRRMILRRIGNGFTSNREWFYAEQGTVLRRTGNGFTLNGERFYVE